MRPAEQSYVDKARVAWGNTVPDWILSLAEEADRTSGEAAALKIGYSAAVVSNVLRAKYPGALGTVAERVRGALMGQTVDCPVWGDIGRDRCLTEQSLPFLATSSARAQCYRACRSGCPNSRLPTSPSAIPGKDLT